MKLRVWIIAGCVSVLALGSVMALAQSASPEVAQETAPSPIPLDVSNSPPAAPQTSPPQSAPETEPASVEDEAIELPTAPQSDWAPDINLDAQAQADVATAAPRRKAKPRKILSDAGENALGTNSWSQSSNSEAAQAALLARSNRRERAIDPVKRSQLTRLARVMGALHALRVSCSGRDDQTYRSRMATMLDLEAPDSGELRDPLVDAFNGGFQVYGRGANACPTDARVQEASLAKEGFGLARDMSARYRPVAKANPTLPPASQPRQNAVVAQNGKAPKPTTVAVPVIGATSPPSPDRASWNKATSN